MDKKEKETAEEEKAMIETEKSEKEFQEEKESEEEKETEEEKEEKEKEVVDIINGYNNEESVEKIKTEPEESEKDEIVDDEINKEEEQEKNKEKTAEEIINPSKEYKEEIIEENKEKATEEEEINKEKKSRSDKDTKKLVILILSLFAIFIITLLVSRYLYANNSTPENPSYTYGGFRFVKISGLWHTQWQQNDKLYNVHLRYGPRESEDIPYYAESSSFDPTGTLYITFDPGRDLKYVALASAELSLSLANTFNMTPIAACTNNETGCGTRPIITCDNTGDAVIYIQQAAQPSITTKENCLIIQGQGEDLVRAADKVLWIWYGIIK